MQSPITPASCRRTTGHPPAGHRTAGHPPASHPAADRASLTRR